MRKFSSFRKWGFTLIELLVVIAIISILASIVFANVKSIRQKVKRTAALQSFQQITQAMYMYYEGNWQEGSWWDDPPPPFVPGIYPSWDATYYCSDCVYVLDVWDENGDGKAGCSYISIHDPMLWDNYVIKNIICEDCSYYCGDYEFYPP